MILQLASLVVLWCLAAAGPITSDDSKCAQYCSEGSTKYQFSPDTSYIFSYVSKNELQAQGTSDIVSKLEATVKITSISKCEMVLELSDVVSSSYQLSEQLQRNPLPFAWNDGKVEHVCSNTDDSNEVLNIKKAILSSIQNTMKSFEMSIYNVDTDILGTCDISYKAKELVPDKYEILKIISIPSCSDHVKGQTLLLQTFYQSSSNRHHFPLLTNEKATCKQIIYKGLIKEVECEEEAIFKPLSDYGYEVKAIGHSKLKHISVRPAATDGGINSYKALKRENLVFKYQPYTQKRSEAADEAENSLREICENSEELIKKEAASYVHKLVYSIRQMDAASIERIYNALKNNEICSSGKKALSIYMEALRVASSGGSVALLTKLTTTGELSEMESKIWLTLLPFISYAEEESVASLIPLLKKGVANTQTLLGTTALAYKYCSIDPECESSQAIKDFSSALKEFLGDKCSTENEDEEKEVLTALKGYGNMGYFGERAKDLFDCALTKSNKMALRMAAIDAFRRSPCKEEVSSKLLEIYSNKNEHDEIRIAALVSISKCFSKEIMKRVVDVYSSETSKQVMVFTWTLLENIRTSQEPTKANVRKYLDFMTREYLKKPESIDMTKFSRNFDLSFFSSFLNLGVTRDANIIHSADSLLPRTGNIAYKLNTFGHQFETLEIGARMENLEHILEKIFGPVGELSNADVKTNKVPANSYEEKIKALTEIFGYQRNKIPHGTVFLRIMGHELGHFNLNQDTFKDISGSKDQNILKSLASLGNMDASKFLFFLDDAYLFPSVTGRSYKFATNTSFMLGMKSKGKIDLKANSPIPQVDIDGIFQPSILAEVSGTFAIHNDLHYEPGFQIETVLNAGLDYRVKLELKNGRLMHVKLTREKKRSEILNLKQTLYYMNPSGKIKIDKPPSHNLNYCTKYLQKFTGAKVCASLMLPHVYETGKFEIPFVKDLEASIVVEQTDLSMDGYEFLLEIPDFRNTEEKRFRFVIDTPNSIQDRKFSLEYTGKTTDANSHSSTFSLHTPFYTLNATGNIMNNDDYLRFNTIVIGDGKRHYSLNVDVTKVTKDANIIEYQPRVTLTLPSSAPMKFTGALLLTKGQKTQLTVNMESRSFASPFVIHGEVEEQGELINFDANWKLNYAFNVEAFSQTHSFYSGIGYDMSKGMYFNGEHEAAGQNSERVSFSAKAENIKIIEQLSFNFDSKVLFSEHQDLNTMLKWDFSFKPFYHLKNDIVLRYGENLADDTHLVRLTLISALHGDFIGFQKLNFENKAGITISCLDIDTSASLSAIWDFIEKPKLIIEAGIKTAKDKEIKIDLSSRQIEEYPLKLVTHFTFTRNADKFQYRDEIIEISPKTFHWKSLTEYSEHAILAMDFIYRIKNQNDFHHEYEGTIHLPKFGQPVKQKGHLKFSESILEFESNTDFGQGLLCEILLKLEEEGTNELKLNMPCIEGNFVIDGTSPIQTVRADFIYKGKMKRRIVGRGKITPGDTNTLDLNVQWDDEKNQKQRLTIQLTFNKETGEGLEVAKYKIGGFVNYGNPMNLSASISTDVINGPHFFIVGFIANKQPATVKIEYEIKDWHLKCITRYSVKGAERIRTDVIGKLIYQKYSHFEIEGGLRTSSPYKYFEGKSVLFRLMADSNEDSRTFVSEYHAKISSKINYEGKFDYQRKRGYPGTIRSNMNITVRGKPIYEGNTNVHIGNKNYSYEISYMQVIHNETTNSLREKRIYSLTLFEHASRFLAFHHSSRNFHILKSVDINAVVDLRNIKDAKVLSNFDVNSHNFYYVNTTLKIQSIDNFDFETALLSKITPSLKLISRARVINEVPKVQFGLKIDSKTVMKGIGEFRKQKNVYDGNIRFKYKNRDIFNVTVKQEHKTKNEKIYTTKLQFPSRSYFIKMKENKEKSNSVNYDMKFCRNEELCISIDATHRKHDDTNEWQISYKRGDVEFNTEIIRESSETVERFHTVIYKGDQRFGYDVRFGAEGIEKSLSLGIIFPSREIVIKGTSEFSLSKSRVKLDLSADGRNHPDRKLTIDVKFENHLRNNGPANDLNFNITISHPTFVKPIEIKLLGGYDPLSSRYFTAEGSVDYSNDPEDKLIGKLSVEESSEITDLLILNIYHKDEDHLDFVIKMNSTCSSNENTFAVSYKWKDEKDTDMEVDMVGSYLKSEKRVYFVYHLPNLNYKLDGKIKSTGSLLNNTSEVDLESVYNGKSTKGRLVSDYETGCHKLSINNDEEETSRIVELCFNFHSRKFLSLISEGMNGENLWILQYISEFVHKDSKTIGFRQQINQEFLKSSRFELTSLINELEEAGVGKVPFYNSPRFKIIRRSFSSNVWDPFKQVIVPEIQAFPKDIVAHSKTIYKALVDYYSTLPSDEAVTEYIANARRFIRSIEKEIWANFYSYYENYIQKILEYFDNFLENSAGKCENNVDCSSFLKSYQTGGWSGLLNKLKNFLLSLPDKMQQSLESTKGDANRHYKNVFSTLEGTLNEHKCGTYIAKILKLSLDIMKPPVQALLKMALSSYGEINQKISTNKDFKMPAELLKKGYLMLKEEILRLDYQKIIIYLNKHLESLSLISPSSKRVNVNKFDVEKGLIDVDIQDEFISKILRMLKMGMDSLQGYLTESSKGDDINYSWNSHFKKFKRIADFDFIPPYDAQAMILDHQHFVTFDNAFYDFSGECSYLLTRDFQDGNFSLILKPKEGDKSASILVLRGNTSVELTSGSAAVKVSENKMQLPYITEQISVTRVGSTIFVNTNNGLQVKCNLVHQICTFRMSRWYHGKTAGLLGTYNYEEQDEFTVPNGQIANSVNEFVNSWELTNDCKRNTIVQDTEINKYSDFYKICKSHFALKTSPLAACFDQVPPENYFNLCIRYLEQNRDHPKALCNVATAYVTECEKNDVELNLPSSCLTCEAPDGSKIEYGDRKKFENLNKNSLDTVFIIEDHDCNKVLVQDLGNVARSIENELNNEGFTENLFGIVGFGGEIGDPQIFTMKDKLLFDASDVSTVADMFKLRSKNVNSSKAFEAIKHAVTHLSRSYSAKSIVLLSCSACKYDYTSLQFPIAQQLLLERGIGLHVIKGTKITIRKSSIEENIIGVDPDSVYFTKHIAQKDLIGEPHLRSQVIMPKDICIDLSHDVNGSFFSTYPISEASSSEVKNFINVFVKKFLRSVQLSSCQWCDCTSTTDHLPNTVCQPCEIKRPRLPFFVGNYDAQTRTLDAFISYLIHVMSE